MKRDVSRGLDYTPRYMFVLASVGKPWQDVFSEAVARLDSEAPIFHIVARHLHEREPFMRLGDKAFYSGLLVDDGILKIVAPALAAAQMQPMCACHTHSFNGRPFTKRRAVHEERAG